MSLGEIIEVFETMDPKEWDQLSGFLKYYYYGDRGPRCLIVEAARRADYYPINFYEQSALGGLEFVAKEYDIPLDVVQLIYEKSIDNSDLFMEWLEGLDKALSRGEDMYAYNMNFDWPDNDN